MATELQGAEQAVGRHKLLTQQFGQFATGQTPQQLHLEQAVLGVHVAQGAIQVGLVLGTDVRDAQFVVVDRDRGVQLAEHQLAVALRLLVVQVPGQAARCGGNEQGKGGQGAFHRAVLVVMGDASGCILRRSRGDSIDQMPQ